MTNYTSAVGQKFHQDGSVREFRGNTFICPIPETHPLFDEIVWAQQQLKSMKCAGKYAFLPQSSFHMTVFEGLCDQVRDECHWSAKLSQSSSLDETTKSISQLVKPVLTSLKEKRFAMTADCVHNSPDGGSQIRLHTFDAANEAEIRACRDELSAATGIRKPNHREYRFHISLSYKIVHLTEQEEQELAETCQRIDQRLSESMARITPEPIEYTVFDDMFEFVPVPGEELVL